MRHSARDENNPHHSIWKSGKVLGVAGSFTKPELRRSDETQNSTASPVWRAAIRLDTVKDWQPVNWIPFFAQATEMRNIGKLTGNLAAFALDLVRNHHVAPGVHNNVILKSHIEAWAAARGQHPAPQARGRGRSGSFRFLEGGLPGKSHFQRNKRVRLSTVSNATSRNRIKRATFSSRSH